MQQAILYTDGSCGKNKDGGWAYILSFESGKRVEAAGWAEDTTNNRMEMMAAIRGLGFSIGPYRIFLASDSAYMLNTLKHRWYEEWFRNDKPRANLDLWQELSWFADWHRMEYVKIKGHADDETNHKVDNMAVQARKEKLEYTNVINPPAQSHTI